MAEAFLAFDFGGIRIRLEAKIVIDILHLILRTNIMYQMHQHGLATTAACGHGLVARSLARVLEQLLVDVDVELPLMSGGVHIVFL